MIHFDFTVEDVDAENIVWAIREAALKNDEFKMEYITRTDLSEEQKENYCKSLDANKEYMLGLIEKMTNTRIEE